MGDMLTAEEQKRLLELAREAITHAVQGRRAPDADLSTLPQRLREKGASFVTLLAPNGELRGCIGTIEAHVPLAHDVQRNAANSAVRDPRFFPVGPAEVNDLHIELSILTTPRPLDFDGPEDLLAKIRPAVDGVLIEKDWRRATLLPSVWDKIPDPVEFLSMLCLKAGLSGDEWRRPGLTVHVYQALKVK